jgi:hypothetical protein
MAAGLAAGNIVEIDNLLTAYLPTNALRTITTFTASAGQTTFSVSYTQGLIDVFYNGSNLAQSEYTATNGTSIILATACQLNDIVVVYAYSYSVGAYSGIGGSGTTNYVPKFTASSSIGNSIIQDNGSTITITGTGELIRLTPTGGDNYIAFRNSAGTQIGDIGYDGRDADGLSIWNNNASGNLVFGAGGSRRMTISSGGQIGIGIIPTGSWGMQIYGNGTSNGVARIQLQNSSTGSADADGGGISMEGIDFVTRNNESGVVKWEMGGTERMRITSGGVIEVRNGSTVGGEIKLVGGDNDLAFNGVRGQISIQINGTEEYGFDSLQFYPAPDNANSLGTSGNRWTVVYATTGSINTSDINEKEQIEDLDEIEKSVALVIKSKIKKYKWKDAVIKKGADARIHIGAIAQDVEQSFIDAGLNPEQYGMFCSDTWWELNGKWVKEYQEGAIEKSRKGLRYDELLAFIISVI